MHATTRTVSDKSPSVASARRIVREGAGAADAASSIHTSRQPNPFSACSVAPSQSHAFRRHVRSHTHKSSSLAVASMLPTSSPPASSPGEDEAMAVAAPAWYRADRSCSSSTARLAFRRPPLLVPLPPMRPSPRPPPGVSRRRAAAWASSSEASCARSLPTASSAAELKPRAWLVIAYATRVRASTRRRVAPAVLAWRSSWRSPWDEPVFCNIALMNSRIVLLQNQNNTDCDGESLCDLDAKLSPATCIHHALWY
jgi:hypothetical protein